MIFHAPHRRKLRFPQNLLTQSPMSVKKAVILPPADKVLECAGKVIALIRGGEIVLHRRIGESSLADKMGVSRAVIRSALEHLEMVGLVTRVPRSGTFVKEVSIREFCDAMDIRAALEALSARLAAARGDDTQIKSLLSLGRRVDTLSLGRASGDVSVIVELAETDREFHLAVAKMSGNERLASTLQQQRLIEFTFALTQKTVYRPAKNRAIPTHTEIAEALASHDGNQAEELMRRHVLRTKEAQLSAFTGEMA